MKFSLSVLIFFFGFVFSTLCFNALKELRRVYFENSTYDEICTICKFLVFQFLSFAVKNCVDNKEGEMTEQDKQELAKKQKSINKENSIGQSGK